MTSLRMHRWQPLSSVMRTLWVIWAALLSVLAVGICLFELSVHSAPLTITLRSGETVQTSVWRPLAHPLAFSLRFARSPGQSRPELGEWVTPSVQSDGPAVPSLVFSRPGEPIKILVSVDGQQRTYAALPASSHGETTVERPLKPWAQSPDSPEIIWPADSSQALTQASGKSQFVFTVQEVGSSLQGETVQLLIQPPLTFKAAQSGYHSLWLMFFWPSYAALLAIGGAALLFFSSRRRKLTQTASSL